MNQRARVRPLLVCALLLWGGAAFAQTAAPARKWVSPYYCSYSSPYVQTFLSVLNSGTATETVTIGFMNRSGSRIYSTSYAVAPGALWQLSTAAVPALEGVGTIEITSSSGSVDRIRPTSLILYYGAGSTSAATSPLPGGSWYLNRESTSWSSPLFFASGPYAYTFVSVLNTSPRTETVILEYRSHSGSVLASYTYAVAAGATWNHSTLLDPVLAYGNTGSIHVRAASSGDASGLMPWSAMVFSYWQLSALPGAWRALP